MTAVADRKAMIALCIEAAKAALDARQKLGDQPAPGTAAEKVWLDKYRRLTNQIDSLTGTSRDLVNAMVADTLDRIAAGLGRLEVAAKAAQAEIKKIKDASKLIEKIGRVLNVGTALLGVAAAPGPGSLLALAGTVNKLDSA